MPIDATEVLKNYPAWAKKIFKDPIVKEQLSRYDHFVYVGDSSDPNIWRTKVPHTWCTSNIGKHGVDWVYLAVNLWLFKKCEDAVYFKLTWQ